MVKVSASTSLPYEREGRTLMFEGTSEKDLRRFQRFLVCGIVFLVGLVVWALYMGFTHN